MGLGEGVPVRLALGLRLGLDEGGVLPRDLGFGLDLGFGVG